MSLSVLLLASPELWVAKVALSPRCRPQIKFYTPGSAWLRNLVSDMTTLSLYKNRLLRQLKSDNGLVLMQLYTKRNSCVKTPFRSRHGSGIRNLEKGKLCCLI